ncbi:UDP-N-acetylmuramate dehydrogenase [Deltaproteobacteria bacterium TL4]
MNSCARETAVWKNALSELPLQSRIQWDYSLKRYNTLKVGGKTTGFIDVLSPADLKLLLPFIHHYQIPWFLLGKGSNVLIKDETWPGIIFRLSGEFKSCSLQPPTHQILAGAALTCVSFVQKCIPLGWGGMEFLIGIPGTIGGAIAMNAGAHGAEISEFLQEVGWMDFEGNLHADDVRHFNFSYRHSSLNARVHSTIVTQALFKLGLSDPETVKSRVQQWQQFRFEKQPHKQPNCGSVFKNPPGHYAAQLIEASGLKGFKLGDAQVSEKHSNFMVNLGHATALEILNLITLVQEKVLNDHGVLLETEVQILSAE